MLQYIYKQQPLHDMLQTSYYKIQSSNSTDLPEADKQVLNSCTQVPGSSYSLVTPASMLQLTPAGLDYVLSQVAQISYNQGYKDCLADGAA